MYWVTCRWILIGTLTVSFLLPIQTSILTIPDTLQPLSSMSFWKVSASSRHIKTHHLVVDRPSWQEKYKEKSEIRDEFRQKEREYKAYIVPWQSLGFCPVPRETEDHVFQKRAILDSPAFHFSLGPLGWRKDEQRKARQAGVVLGNTGLL